MAALLALEGCDDQLGHADGERGKILARRFAPRVDRLTRESEHSPLADVVDAAAERHYFTRFHTMTDSRPLVVRGMVLVHSSPPRLTTVFISVPA